MGVIKKKPKKGYEVGYKKPPKHSQFKPGQSGNPNGRPKGTKNLKTDLEEELKERIPIKEAGKAKKVSKQRAMVKALMAKAVSGDTKAVNIVMGMISKLMIGEEAAETTLEDQTATDEAILDELGAMILANAQKKGSNDAEDERISGCGPEK